MGRDYLIRIPTALEQSPWATGSRPDGLAELWLGRLPARLSGRYLVAHGEAGEPWGSAIA